MNSKIYRRNCTKLGWGA